MSTRDRIIEAAARLFSKKPYSRVSVDDVAREAGVSKGAVFHYFKSKLELAERALETFLERLVAAPLRSVLASGAPLEEKVESLVALSVGVTLRSGAKPLLFLAGVYEELRSRGRGQFVRRFYEEYVRTFADFLRGSGVPEPELRARVLMAALDGLALQCMIAPDLFRDEEFVRALGRELARMLRCEP